MDRRIHRRSFLAGITGTGALAAASGGAAGRTREGDAGLRQVSTDHAVEVSPGGSASLDVDVSVGDDETVDRLDVVFCFDMTSSMDEEIAEVKEQATRIMSDISESAENTAFGLAGFMDYPGSYDSYDYSAQYGNTEEDRPWEIHQQVTADTAAVDGAISAVELGHGEDGPESVTRALYELTGGDLGWRPGSVRIVVMFGDNVPHDDDFHEMADEWGDYPNRSTGGDPGPDGEMFTGDDLDFQNVVGNVPMPVICVDSGSYDAHWRYIAEETNGAYYQLGNASEIASEVVALVGAESDTATLTLRAEAGYESWVEPSPASFEDVSTGETRTFEVTVAPPVDATVGTRTLELYGLADGSRVKTVAVEADVYGDTGASIPVAKLRGAGPAVDARFALYEWFQRSFRADFWLGGGREKLGYLAESVGPQLTDLGASLTDRPDAGDGYRSAADAAENVRISSDDSVWGTGVVENRAAENVTDRTVERSGVTDPSVQVGMLKSLLETMRRPDDGGSDPEGTTTPGRERTSPGPSGDAAATATPTDRPASGPDGSAGGDGATPGGGASDDGPSASSGPSKRQIALSEIESLLTYLRSWRNQVETLQVAGAYRGAFEREGTTATIKAREGESATAEFTAADRTRTLTWTVVENGFVPLAGAYEITVDVAGRTGTVTTEGRGGVLRLDGSGDLPAASAGDPVSVTFRVSDPPVSAAPDALSETSAVDLSASLTHSYQPVATLEREGGFADLGPERRRLSRETASRHLDAAIAFFEAEKRLLSPRRMAVVSAFSPVDLRVADETGELGAVYDGDSVDGIAMSMDAEFLYTGPDAEPETFAIVDGGGDFDVEVVGRDSGTYDLEIAAATVTGDGVTTETLDTTEDVSVDSSTTHSFSMSVDNTESGVDATADLSTLGSGGSSSSLVSVAEDLPLPLVAAGVLGGGGALALWYRSRSGTEGDVPEGSPPGTQSGGPPDVGRTRRPQRGSTGESTRPSREGSAGGNSRPSREGATSGTSDSSGGTTRTSGGDSSGESDTRLPRTDQSDGGPGDRTGSDERRKR